MNIDRYSKTPKIIEDGVETYGMWRSPKWLQDRPTPDKESRLIVQNNLEGRPDLIASAIYGSPTLFWVLIAYNNVTDVFGWPKAGDVVKYPPITYVLNDLL